MDIEKKKKEKGSRDTERKNERSGEIKASTQKKRSINISVQLTNIEEIIK